MKKEHAKTGIIKSAIKYCHGKMVSSANQNVAMKVILRLSQEFIQMAQLGFSVEQNLKDEILGG